MSLKIELEIYSPRWGHNDPYDFELSKQELIITSHIHEVKCTYVDGRDPVWSTHKSLDDIFTNDSIVGPAKIEEILEYVWCEWRDGNLSDDEVKNELYAIVDWINIITANKPKTDFWKKYF